MELDERIKYARTEAQLTQTEVAKALGCARAAVSQWENGHTKNLKMEHLFKLAEITGFRAKWLALGIGEMREQSPVGDLTVSEIHLIEVWRAMHPNAKRRAMSILIMEKVFQSEYIPAVHGPIVAPDITEAIEELRRYMDTSD